MGHLLSYSITSGIVLLILYLVYSLLLSDENQPKTNRIVLMCIYGAAITVPLIPGIYDISFTNNANAIEIGMLSAQDMPTTNTESRQIDIWTLLPVIGIIVWLCGIFIMILQTAYIHLKIRRIISRGSIISTKPYTIVETDNSQFAPFSYCRTIILHSSDTDDTSEMIIAHEQMHIQSHHWVDLLISRAYLIFNWFNPAAWLMTEALKSVHEYQADHAVLSMGISARDYQLLLIKKAVGKSFPALANSLNHSKLKKRITMMLKAKSSKSRRMRAFALVPATAVAVAVFNVPFMANALNAVSSTEIVAESQTPQSTDDKVSKKIETSIKLNGDPIGDMRVIVDGKEIPSSEIDKISKDQIKSITVDKKGNFIIIETTKEHDGSTVIADYDSTGDPIIVTGVRTLKKQDSIDDTKGVIQVNKYDNNIKKSTRIMTINGNTISPDAQIYINGKTVPLNKISSNEGKTVVVDDNGQTIEIQIIRDAKMISETEAIMKNAERVTANERNNSITVWPKESNTKD